MILLTICNTSLFFFSSRRRHTRCLSDWSSDVCSSDLIVSSVWRNVNAFNRDPRSTRDCDLRWTDRLEVQRLNWYDERLGTECGPDRAPPLGVRSKVGRDAGDVRISLRVRHDPTQRHPPLPPCERLPPFGKYGDGSDGACAAQIGRASASVYPS